MLFDACDGTGRQIYHTNVMMSIGSGWAVVCRDAIVQNDRARVLQALSEGGRRVIELSLEQVGAWCHVTRHPSRAHDMFSLSLFLSQMSCFACNILELRAGGKRVVAMSAKAHASLTV